METKYQQTLHFSDANVEERRSIYEDIGLKKVSMIQGLNEKSAETKRSGIDVSGTAEFGRIKIKEIFCDYMYSYMLMKKIPVELYSDFEDSTQGWLGTSSANTVFYFFRDAIVSTDIQQLRDFVDQIREDGSFDDMFNGLVSTFIEHNVNGKSLESVEGVSIYVQKKEDGHHSAGLTLEVNSLPDDAMDISEYYFEEEEEAPEEEPEPEEEE